MQNPAEEPSAQPRLWQVKIALVATAAQHEEVMDRISELLCPDPNHEGPCPVPWAMHSVNEDSLSKRQRKVLLTEVKETNWNPVEAEESSTPEGTGDRLQEETAGGGYAYCADIARFLAARPTSPGSPTRWLDHETAVRSRWRALVTARRTHLGTGL